MISCAHTNKHACIHTREINSRSGGRCTEGTPGGGEEGQNVEFIPSLGKRSIWHRPCVVLSLLIRGTNLQTATRSKVLNVQMHTHTGPPLSSDQPSLPRARRLALLRYCVPTSLPAEGADATTCFEKLYTAVSLRASPGTKSTHTSARFLTTHLDLVVERPFCQQPRGQARGHGNHGDEPRPLRLGAAAVRVHPHEDRHKTEEHEQDAHPVQGLHDCTAAITQPQAVKVVVVVVVVTMAMVVATVVRRPGRGVISRRCR